MVYVTHDQIEAMTLADKIVVLKRGRSSSRLAAGSLQQAANRFVAGFIGAPRMNFLEARQPKGRRHLFAVSGGEVRLPPNLEEPAEIGIRPEHVSLTARGAPDTLAGKVTMTEHLGSDTYAYVALDGAQEMLVVRLSGESAIKRNEPIGVHVDPSMLHVFSAGGLSLASARPVALEAA
jgi:ABC-type sugar transport system ATPase subunit